MQNFEETDPLTAIAFEVCHELFEVAERDTKIMVNNWCAFAVLAMFRELSLLHGGNHIPTIDECMSGANEPQCLSHSAEWLQLKEWHNKHWRRSQKASEWASYAPYIFMQSITIGKHILTL